MSKKVKLGKLKSKNKIDLIGKIIDLPKDPLGKTAHITLFGDKEVSIDGCYGIVEYSSEIVKINIGNKILAIRGSRLDIADYTATSMLVKGKIVGLDFC